MFKLYSHLNGVIGLLMLTFTPFLFAAQNPVAIESRESQFEIRPAQSTLPYQAPIEDEFAATQRTTANIVSGSGESQYQIQLLQQEVLDLRGLVEELSFQLGQMRSTQNDRYLELDGRVQRLSSQGGSAVSATIGNTSSVEPVGGDGAFGATIGSSNANSNSDADSASSSSGQVATIQDEKTLYNNAVELIRARQYQLAISQLETVIEQYPQGQFTANAYYWLGEVQAAKPDPDYDAARQALAQVITFFPENRKVPDAAFKLGKVYHLTGDCSRATQMLQQVITQHEGKTAAKLAADYLRDRVGTCNPS